MASRITSPDMAKLTLNERYEIRLRCLICNRVLEQEIIALNDAIFIWQKHCDDQSAHESKNRMLRI